LQYDSDPSLVAYDTGNRRLNPPAKAAQFQVETTASTRVAASERLRAAFSAVRALELPAANRQVLRAGLDVAEIVHTLDADDDVVIAAMLQPLLDANLIDREGADKLFGVDAVRLARNLSQLGEFGLPADWRPEQGLEAGQAEALRKMLLAVIGDVRLVVVRLAGQLQKMRAAKSLDQVQQRKLAIAGGLCPSRQSIGRVAGEVGDGGSRISLFAERRVQEDCGSSQGSPLRARALHG
jgi:hypothetical protein